MVCPYRLVTTFFAAIASVFYIRSTFAEDDVGGESGKTGDQTVVKKTAMSSQKRALIVSLLIVLHVDLLVTGYLRAGLKEGFAMLSAIGAPWQSIPVVDCNFEARPNAMYNIRSCTCQDDATTDRNADTASQCGIFVIVIFYDGHATNLSA
eukprot:scaffold1034_cov127-Cylindrotheca_fusiformis.AAC.19